MIKVIEQKRNASYTAKPIFCGELVGGLNCVATGGENVTELGTGFDRDSGIAVSIKMGTTHVIQLLSFPKFAR